MAVAVILMGSYPLWSQEAAGWAQAIGTAVAVVSAVWIAGWQDRKTQRRNAEQQTKKAKSVVACFKPILQTIKSDVEVLIGLTRYAQEEMPSDAIKATGYHFRELPHYVSFVLDNADLLPGDAIMNAPQLLAFRECAANEMAMILQYEKIDLEKYLEGLSNIMKWLVLMQQLIKELDVLLVDLHDRPVTRLLDK
jgi:hypothetical protein